MPGALRGSSYGTWLLALTAVTLCALAASLALPAPTPAARAHGILAVGVLPLVLGAIGYFTPSLTQTGAPPSRLIVFPALGLLSGALAVGAVGGSPRLLALAVPTAAAAGAGVLGWTCLRARAGLGDAHPCLRWYQASLICLLSALAAAGLAGLRPAWWDPLRRLHLHLNLLGFVGLVAVGTLHVLLPTVSRISDPTVAGRLHRGLPFAAVGVVLVAAGAAVDPLRGLAYVGAVCWCVPVLGLLFAIARDRAHHTRLALPLIAAVVGLGLAVMLGALGRLVDVPPRRVLGLFWLGFLLPLITGALAHLIPIWRHPGASTPARERAQVILGWGSGLRAAVFLTAALAHVFRAVWSAPLAAAVLVVFVLQVSAAALPTRDPSA